MRPFEQGIRLESVQEIGTAAAVTTFIGNGEFPLPEDQRAVIQRLGRSLTDMSMAYQGLTSVQERVAAPDTEPGMTLEIVDPVDATIVVKSLQAVARANSYPDPLHQQSAADMVRSYEDAVFENAMQTPPEAQS